jgi:dihydroorotate dehydrogenase
MKAYDLARALLFSADAETAHGISILALRAGIVPRQAMREDGRLGQTICGIAFPNPVGLAAGFDKNAEVPDAMLGLGFGFVEVGTVTPRAQAGNPRPRIFRLPEAGAVINRLGFNNGGHEAVLARLNARAGKSGMGGGIVGVNIGANKDSEDFIADYEAGIDRFAGVADYFTANISSPNTPGLRSLQAGAALSELLRRVLTRRDAIAEMTAQRRPVFLKIAPDLDVAQMDEIAAVIRASRLDGLIVSNTTLSRTGLEGDANAAEAGGLSGRPLFERSTIVLARMRQHLGSDLPIIGVGGVDSTESAIAKFEAGANLVQLYTGMIYRGPGIACEIRRGLVAELERRKLSHLRGLCGIRTDEWAARRLPGEAR